MPISPERLFEEQSNAKVLQVCPSATSCTFVQLTLRYPHLLSRPGGPWPYPGGGGPPNPPGPPGGGIPWKFGGGPPPWPGGGKGIWPGGGGKGGIPGRGGIFGPPGKGGIGGAPRPPGGAVMISCCLLDKRSTGKLTHASGRWHLSWRATRYTERWRRTTCTR